MNNSNLIRNADYLLATLSKTNDKIVWVGENNRQFGCTKFKLIY